MNGHIAGPVSDTGDAGRSIKLRRDSHIFAKKRSHISGTRPRLRERLENVGFQMVLPSQPSRANGSPPEPWGKVSARFADICTVTSRLRPRQIAVVRFSERQLSPNLSTSCPKYRARKSSFINATPLRDLESGLLGDIGPHPTLFSVLCLWNVPIDGRVLACFDP